jgi:hypothetical protein
VSMEPYYSDAMVTLYLGDCREITAWLAADVLVMDPPYGRAWRQGRIEGQGAGRTRGNLSVGLEGIRGDGDVAVRDAVLAAWPAERVAVAFGDLMLAPPVGTRQTMVYCKPPDAGTRGATAGRRRDVEAIYLIGPWPSGIGTARGSLLTTTARAVGSPSGLAARYGHPHAKPVDIMAELISMCPGGVIADPFAGAGSTLVAAKQLGRRAIGVELEEQYCERAAERLAEPDLFGGAA